MGRKKRGMKAVCLTSGGLDSTTCLAIAKKEGRRIYALSFLYGQRHGYEISAAQRVASFFKAEKHLCLSIELGKVSRSSLTDLSQTIPITTVSKDINEAGSLSMESSIPNTYVPGRNLIFLSLAVAWAETIGANEIFIGANSLDYSGYPDCRPAFLESFEKTAQLATKAGVINAQNIRIRAPVLYMSKAEIIRTGLSLGVDYSMTSSCYQPDIMGRPCGKCHSCQLRLKGFKEAGLSDPLEYQNI
jgi:7-cyano-7-deazaguanine synthase